MMIRAVGLVVAVGLLAGVALGADEAVRVERPKATVEYKQFDPKNLPDPPPPIEAGEAAVCVYKFGVEADVKYSYRAPANPPPGPVKVDVKIEGVMLRLSLGSTIWLPTDANQHLKDHEEGHRQIAEHYYAGADRLAKGLAGKLVGQTVSGEGKDAKAAGRAAIDGVSRKLCDEYLKAINGPCGRAQAAFDRMTDHSRKDVPSAKEAVGRAIREAESKG
jgi:hypothetical protein